MLVTLLLALSVSVEQTDWSLVAVSAGATTAVVGLFLLALRAAGKAGRKR